MQPWSRYFFARDIITKINFGCKTGRFGRMKEQRKPWRFWKKILLKMYGIYAACYLYLEP